MANKCARDSPAGMGVSCVCNMHLSLFDSPYATNMKGKIMKKQNEAKQTETKTNVTAVTLTKAQKQKAASVISVLRRTLPVVKAIDKPSKDNNGIIRYAGKVYPSATQAFLAYNEDKRKASNGINVTKLESILFKYSSWNMHTRTTGEVTTLSTCRSVDNATVCFAVFHGTDMDGKLNINPEQLAKVTKFDTAICNELVKLLK